MKVILPRWIANLGWLQWSLRSCLILTTILAIGFAWWGAKLHNEARIKNAVQLISISPGWWVNDDYDPVAVVRAVNALHALGKRDAIKALRRFAKANPTSGAPDARLEALRLIIPLLFDHVDPEDKFPSALAYDDPGVYRLDQREWLFFTGLIFVEGDIPFHLVPAGGFSGSMGDFSYAIDWAEKSGRFRSTPLKPTDSPFAAADQIVLEIRRLKNDPNSGFFVELPEVKRRTRQQVLKAIAHLLSANEIDKYQYSKNWDGAELSDNYRSLADDAYWKALNELCIPLAIRWNTERQSYVSSRP